MALLKLQFKPGINRDVTNYSGEGGWCEDALEALVEKTRMVSRPVAAHLSVLEAL